MNDVYSKNKTTCTQTRPSPRVGQTTMRCVKIQCWHCNPPK